MTIEEVITEYFAALKANDTNKKRLLRGTAFNLGYFMVYYPEINHIEAYRLDILPRNEE